MLKQQIESKVLPVVQKPMRYMGGELHCIKKDLSKTEIHGVFCFPDLYDIGMSHFGLQILYHIVNRYEKWTLSRAFHPWSDAEKVLRENRIPLYSLEYFTPVKDADWVGFSVQYELQYTNIINMLDLSEITVFQDQRQEHEPIIIAGGPCVSNPAPLSLYVDAFVVGDGEEIIVTICKTLENLKRDGSTRKQKLAALAQISGIYVPSLHQYSRDGRFIIQNDRKTVNAVKIKNLDSGNYPSKSIVPLMEVVHHRLPIEVMRGCTRGCRFCSAGMIYRPVREREPLEIFNSIQSGAVEAGWRDIGLLSLSTADYSCMSSLLSLSSDLAETHHVSLSLPSTRIDALTDDQIRDLNSISPISSMTIAPEAGSVRLRQVINKDFSDEQIFATVDRLLANNIQTLKLYFMIGLPTETQEDIDAIVAMVNVIAGKVRAASQRRVINVSISPFSPKPHTPFQREAMFSVENLLQKGRYIKQSLKFLKNVKVSYRNPDITLLETIMARGDRDIGLLIFEAWKNGAKCDGWDEFFDLNRWVTSAQQLEIDLLKYTSYIADSESLPWQNISMGVSQKFLLEERDRAYNQFHTVDCRKDQCSSCGVCNESVKSVLKKDQVTKKTSDLVKSKKNMAQISQACHYRIFYNKGDLLRFLGHLDMAAIVHRAFQIAKIPVAFSQGFNPHAKVSFGPPLPLGVAGINEAFDVTTTEPITVSISELNRWLPEALVIQNIQEISNKEISLNSSIKAARYVFSPIKSGLMQGIDTIISEVMKSEVMKLEVEKKGQTIIKDLRKGILSMKNIDNSSFDAVLAIQDGITCKPSELIRFLFSGCIFCDFLVTRVDCFEILDGKLRKI